MKDHVLKLNAIAKKRRRLIIGLMSGTSLDGLDVALCAFTGAGKQTKVEVLQFETLAYTEDFKSDIRKIFAQKTIEFQDLVLLNVQIANEHARLIHQCLQQWQIAAETVDLLASHGQTVYHAPRVFHQLPNAPNATLQIGDGDHLARQTGIITLSDFRQKHVAAGGEGAPLALYGDYYLFSKKGAERYLLNIGGIANFTYLPENQDPSRIFASDTGPGNTLLDAFAWKFFGVPFDDGARLALNGRIDEHLLQILKSDPFFAKKLPKTIGPELFSPAWVQSALLQLPKGNPNPYDVMATLTRLTAETIADAILQTQAAQMALIATPASRRPILYLSGGGAHNPLIVSYLSELLPSFKLRPMADLGIHGDAKEAVLFAVLANEAIAGRVGEGSELGGIPLVGMGKISFPG